MTGPGPLRLRQQAQQVLLRGRVGGLAEAREHRHDGRGSAEEEVERSPDPAQPRAAERRARHHIRTFQPLAALSPCRHVALKLLLS